MAKFGFMGLRRVKVAGESMSPTYNNGDVLLVKWFTGTERELPLTSVVVIERDKMPGVFFIKRIQSTHHFKLQQKGTNPSSGSGQVRFLLLNSGFNLNNISFSKWALHIKTEHQIKMVFCFVLKLYNENLFQFMFFIAVDGMLQS